MPSPILLSQGLLAAAGVTVQVQGSARLPPGPLLVLANHRSILDGPVLMAALNRPIRFACHHFMGQIPGLRETIGAFGGFILAEPERRAAALLRHGSRLLRAGEVVGVFPEGATPMVRVPGLTEVGEFFAGAAHLALRSPLESLTVLPVAIAAAEETVYSSLPLRWVGWFDPTEPLFNADGLHPVALYRRAIVRVGQPMTITPELRQAYREDPRGQAVDLTQLWQRQIMALLARP